MFNKKADMNYLNIQPITCSPGLLSIFVFTVFWIAALASCSDTENEQSKYDFDLQGHRGARGLLPENTIPSFLKAAELGVDTIEMDLVVSGDSQLVVSHEPWFNHKISTKPDGSPVTENEAKDLNILQMTAEEIRKFDVGKRGNPDFPDQKPVEASKPLFKEAINQIEQFVKENSLKPVSYNIETKSDPDYYGIMVPQPETFAELLYRDLQSLGITGRSIVQSFDVNTLKAMRKIDPDVTLALLVENSEPVEENLNRLGFTPDIYSPYYKNVNRSVIETVHAAGMKLIPWTINDVSEMRTYLEMGADGIITDYPDRALELRK